MAVALVAIAFGASPVCHLQLRRGRAGPLSPGCSRLLPLEATRVQPEFTASESNQNHRPFRCVLLTANCGPKARFILIGELVRFLLFVTPTGLSCLEGLPRNTLWIRPAVGRVESRWHSIGWSWQATGCPVQPAKYQFAFCKMGLTLPLPPGWKGQRSDLESARRSVNVGSLLLCLVEKRCLWVDIRISKAPATLQKYLAVV